MKPPLVSIVIPAYNPPLDKFNHCMQSVLSQSYKKTEVILVDDGSMTNYKGEMDTWMQRDHRVHVMHQMNSGVGKARNYGIERACGKYICFVDADDIVTRSWVEDAVGMAEETDADIVYCSVYMTESQHMECNGCEDIQVLSRIYEGLELSHVQEMLLLNNGGKSPLPGLPYLDFGPCGKLFRTDIVKRVLFPVDMPLAEDQVFNHELLRKSRRVAITNIPAYYYIVNPGSATHRKRPDAVNIMLHAMECIRATLFETMEVYNAFYYRFLCEIILGIQIAYFHKDDNSLTLQERMARVNQTLLLPPVREAWENIDLKNITDKKVRIKILLMKKKLFILLDLFWSVKFLLRHNIQRLEEKGHVDHR